MDSDREQHDGRVPLPGFGATRSGRRARAGPPGRYPARPADVELDRSPRSSPGPGPPPWRWPTTPSPRPPEPRTTAAGATAATGTTAGTAAHGASGPPCHSFGRDDQRVRRHRDDHDAHRERQDHRHATSGTPGLPRQLRGMTMTTGPAALPGAAPWRRISTGDTTVAVAQRDALGTTARVAVWPPEHAGAALAAVDDVLSALDRQASRFRPDSEISWLHRSRRRPVHAQRRTRRGHPRRAGRGARGPAGWPTRRSGAPSSRWATTVTSPPSIPSRPDPPAAPVPAPGWQSVRLDGPLLQPAGRRAARPGRHGQGPGIRPRRPGGPGRQPGTPAGTLVSLGGDIAIGGIPPRAAGRSWWPTRQACSRTRRAAPAQRVRLARGAVATSSITCRQWRRAGRMMHHIVDPRTGLPADGPWQMVSVAAATCADANAAATAAVVAGERGAGVADRGGSPGPARRPRR